MRFLLIALCAALTLSSGCDTDPCASREARAAFVGLGGPLGVAAVLALSCPQPEPEQPIAAVPLAGLVELQPEVVAPPDMGSVPDLSPPPPLVCGPLSVLTSYNGSQFCERDGDGDGVADRLDACPALAAGQAPDAMRRGCPAPRTYTIVLPPAAFAAGGNVTIHDGVASALPDYDWVNLRHSPATLSSVLFFQNGSANATNSVKFQLVGVADFTAPVTTLDACSSLAKDNRGQDAVTRAPNDIACIARRLDLCPVDLVTPASKLAGEAACARSVGSGSGYVSKASAPVTLTASVSSADWISSEPKPVAGIEIQVLMSGTLKLAGWQVVAEVTETLR